MQYLLRHILFVFSLGISCLVYAQNGTSSPYSRYALGELGDYAPSAYRAMGGVRYGMRSNRTVNAAQPASYTACDSMTFMFDISAHASWMLHQDAAGKRNRFNGNLDYLTLQFPIWKQHIAMSVGILPYSKVGYNMTLTDSIPNKYHYTQKYYGEGGITDLYGGVSGNLFDWVALGVNAYYMFGEVDNYRELTFQESNLASVIDNVEIDVRTLRLRYGLQIFHTFGQHGFILGGVYEHKMNMNGTYTRYATSSAVDSIETKKNEGLLMPHMFGIGASYVWDKRLTLSVEYEQQMWGRADFLKDTEYGKETLSDYHRFSLGAEYRHNPFDKNYAGRMYWRLGMQLKDSYAKSVTAKDLNVSVGMGFPMRNAGTIFNVTLEYKRRGIGGGMSENGIQITFNAAVRENWFFKRKL